MLRPDRWLAAQDKANGPVYLIAYLFVDNFIIHCKNDLLHLETLGRVDRFRANSLLGRSDSLLARINSLLGRVGNSAANC